MAAVDYDFNYTRNQILQRAFRIVGALSLGETLSADMSTQGIEALNAIIKEWQSKHIFLWSMVEQNASFLAGADDYVLGSDPAIIGLDRAWVRDSSNNDTPLQIITWRQYEEIQNKTDTGTPTHITFDSSLSISTPRLLIWPVPTKTEQVYWIAVRKLKDMDSSSGNPDAPVKAIRALVYALADDLSDEYGLSVADKQRITTKANEAFAILRGADVVTPTEDFVEGAYST